MRIWFVISSSICFSALLAACGGGGGDSSPAPTPQSPPMAPLVPPGRYAVSGSTGYLLSSGEEAIYVERDRMGAGLWDRSATPAGLAMLMLAFVNDDLGNETPSAKSTNDALTVSQTQLTLASSSAPPISSIPRTWKFANLYRFGSTFVDYTAQIDIDSSGVLTGFDTNGCNFTGELRSRTDGASMYEARIIANNCGNTGLFIEPGEYKGHAYMNSDLLEIAAVIPTQKLGLHFQLSKR